MGEGQKKMRICRKRYEKKISRVYRNGLRLKINHNSRFVLMSDCHRGVGNRGDNFLSNQNIFYAALQHYNRRKFTYIELGDGDELWENKNMNDILNIHGNQFWLMSEFYKTGRFYMIYGNHDKYKRSSDYIRCVYNHYVWHADEVCYELFPGMKVYEGIVLQDECSTNEILLLHGHQADFINDELWHLTRFMVRYLWRNAELMGVNDPTSAAKNYQKKKKVEMRLSDWSDRKKIMVIAGHTHRPVLPEPGEGLYLNDGSCVHPRCITALEIEGNRITLVKWEVKTRANYDMYVGREVLEGPYWLDAYFRDG